MYWGTDDVCRFCGIELTLQSGQTIPVKRPEHLAEVAVAARDLDGAVDVTLTTGTTHGHDKGAMTRLIDQMEARGWLSRQRDDEDRRLIRLTLTEAGTQKAIAAKRKVIACWNGILADWSDGEVADLIAMLQRLRGTMEEKMGEESDPCAA